MTENTFLNPKKQPFMCGVCEGFYGKPWTFSQRQELFKRMQRFGMNAYLYAPKDDYKHRLYWRDLYTDEEAEELRSLIREAEERNVRFIYAISPGLDIVYSSALDVLVLKKKLEQVKNLGCQNFALLFDDIEDELCSEDMNKFASIADAQCFMTNDIYNYLNQPHLFLFCPTEYCSSRSLPDVLKSTYLKTVGLRLDQRIEFLWTGPKVVSRRITVENVSEVGVVVRRQVTLWDNLHANDYDQTRLYLGPYSGRPTELLGCLRGVLTNPNCEFEANYIALHTLAQWSCNKVARFPVTMASPIHGEADMEVEEEEVVVESSYEKGSNENQSSTTSSKPADAIGYDPRKALQSAVADWLPELYKTKSPFGQHLSSTTMKGYFAPATSSPSNNNKVKDLGEEVRSMEEYYEEKVHDLDLESDGAGKELEEEMKKIDEDVPMTSADEVGGRREEEEEEERLKSALREAMASSETTVEGLKKQSSMVGYQQQQQQSSQSVVGGFYYDYRKRQHDALLTGEEVMMICDFFYLPFEHGPSGDEMLRAATWLVDNFDIVYRAAPFSCYGGGGTGQRLTSFVPQLHLSDSLSPYSSSPPNSPISDRTTSPPPPPPPPLLTQSNVAATTGASLLKPDKNIVFINASISNSTTLVGSTGTPAPARTAKTRFVQDTYLSTPSASEWYERAIRFHDGYGDLSAVVDKLVNIPNRELLYELYKYVNDMRSNLALVNSYIKWHGIDKREKELFKSGEQEPWVHRGGLLAEFRRLLPFDRESPHGRNSNVLVVRPFYTKDRVDVNSVCLRTYNDTMDASYWLGTMPNLVGDCKIGAFLQYFSKYCFVLEDDLGICGYVVASDNVKDYRSHLEKTWLPEMRLKYPIIETTVDKKPAATTSSINESTAGMASESLGGADPSINQSEKVPKEEEMSRQESEERQEDVCPMSSSEQSRSPSPTNYCPTFSVLDSVGANQIKSQTLSIEALLKALHADHKPVLKEDCNLFLKYPSPISIGLLYGKGSAAKLLLASVEQALANAGSQGMHVILPANHKASIDLYKRLGFREERAESGEGNETKMDDINKDPTVFESIGPEDVKHSGFDPQGSVILCKPIIPAPEGDGYQSVGSTLGHGGIRQFLNQQQVNLGEELGASQGSVCSNITISTTAATLGSVGSMESGEASDSATLEQQKL